MGKKGLIFFTFLIFLSTKINIQASQAETESLHSLYNEIVCISDTSKRVKLVIFGPEQNMTDTTSVEAKVHAWHVLQAFHFYSCLPDEYEGMNKLKNIIYKNTKWIKYSIKEIQSLNTPIDPHKEHLAPSIYYLQTIFAMKNNIQEMVHSLLQNNAWGALECPYGQHCKSIITNMKNLFNTIASTLYTKLYDILKLKPGAKNFLANHPIPPFDNNLHSKSKN